MYPSFRPHFTCQAMLKINTSGLATCLCWTLSLQSSITMRFRFAHNRQISPFPSPNHLWHRSSTTIFRNSLLCPKLAVKVLPFFMAMPLRALTTSSVKILYGRFPRSWIRKGEGKSGHQAHHTSLHLTWSLRLSQACDVRKNIKDLGHFKEGIWNVITCQTLVMCEYSFRWRVTLSAFILYFPFVSFSATSGC